MFRVPGSKFRNLSFLPAFRFLQRFDSLLQESRVHCLGIVSAPWMSMVAKHYWELDAWQAVRTFKMGIYDLIEREPLAGDVKLREQLRESVASAQSHIAEGYGRFDPLDNARFVKMARASMLECHNHLGDAVDRKRITEDTRREHLSRWEGAMKEIGGLLDYLQSPEAKRNADRIRQRRTERRRQRKQGPSNPEP